MWWQKQIYNTLEYTNVVVDWLMLWYGCTLPLRGWEQYMKTGESLEMGATSTLFTIIFVLTESCNYKYIRESNRLIKKETYIYNFNTEYHFK